jgi:hypothetical protein
LEKPLPGLGHNTADIERIIQERKDKQVAQRAEEAEPLAKQGRPSSNGKGDNITFNSRRTDANYLTRRIARDHPDILRRMKAGEFKSVRAAAIGFWSSGKFAKRFPDQHALNGAPR